MSEIEAPRIFLIRRYRDARKMIDWLEKAFGFQLHYLVANEDGSVAHSQVRFGSSMIMISDYTEGELAEPTDTSASSQSIYLAIDDADSLHERACAAGASIFRGLTDTEYGSRDFGCYDPEGHAWNFGTYWPKAHEKPEN